MTLNLMQKAVLLLLFLVSSYSCSSQAKQENRSTQKSTINENDFPKAIGYVNDFASILDSLEIQSLETKLKKYDSQTTNQIAIVTLNDKRLTDETFEEYAVNLTKVWGVGTKEKNNGLTIVLSPQLRRIRIVTGRGTEKILTDKICEEVLQSIIIPEFKNGNYFDGINKAIDEFINRWK